MWIEVNAKVRHIIVCTSCPALSQSDASVIWAWRLWGRPVALDVSCTCTVDLFGCDHCFMSGCATLESVLHICWHLPCNLACFADQSSATAKEFGAADQLTFSGSGIWGLGKHPSLLPCPQLCNNTSLRRGLSHQHTTSLLLSHGLLSSSASSSLPLGLNASPTGRLCEPSLGRASCALPHADPA